MNPQLIDCLLLGVQLLRKTTGSLESGVRFFQFQLILIDFIFQLRVPAPLLHQALLMQLVGRLQSLIMLFCFWFGYNFRSSIFRTHTVWWWCAVRFAWMCGTSKIDIKFAIEFAIEFAIDTTTDRRFVHEIVTKSSQIWILMERFSWTTFMDRWKKERRRKRV